MVFGEFVMMVSGCLFWWVFVGACLGDFWGVFLGPKTKKQLHASSLISFFLKEDEAPLPGKPNRKFFETLSFFAKEWRWSAKVSGQKKSEGERIATKLLVE